jgi:hypothetical protein
MIRSAEAFRMEGRILALRGGQEPGSNSLRWCRRLESNPAPGQQEGKEIEDFQTEFEARTGRERGHGTGGGRG